MTRCHRCGDRFEPRRPGDVHCDPCVRDLALLAAADAKRRAVRFSVAKELAR